MSSRFSMRIGTQQCIPSLIRASFYSTFSSQPFRARPIAVNILDPWIPKRNPWSLNSKDYWKFLGNSMKHWLIKYWSIREIKKNDKQWNKSDFAKTVEKLYLDMNKAFISNNKNKLNRVVTNSMLATLNPLMKRQSAANLKWKYIESIEAPVIVHSRLAKIQVEEKGEQQSLAQCTVKVHTKQSLIGPKNETVNDIVEYIVVEKIVTDKSGNSQWLIAGRISPESEESKK